MRTLCASTLLGEFFVVGFAGLVAMKDPALSMTAVWAVCGGAMFLSLLLCGMIGRPGGVQLGWALQIGLIAAGFVVPAMFFLGTAFAALWWCSLHFGRTVDAAKAAHAAREASADRVPIGQPERSAAHPVAAAAVQPAAVAAPVAAEAATAKPATTKTTGTKPATTKTAGTKPATRKPVTEKPNTAETAAVETTTAESTTAETTTAETTTAESSTAGIPDGADAVETP